MKKTAPEPPSQTREASEPGLNADLLYMRVARLVFGQPLLIAPDAAETIGSYLRTRMEGVAPEASRFVGREAVDGHTGRWKGYRREGTVGIVSILGELVNRGAWLGASSGLTSYEGITEQVRSAATDPDVETIVLDINSPGGEAYGMADTARSLRALARGAGKKMIAVINSVGASAAYGLASAADEIVIGESGVAGSIGVVMVHFDHSERASKLGVKATVITNSDGVDKARGHPFGPLSEEDVSHLRAKADQIMDGFVRLATDHRPKLTEDAVRGQRANTFFGESAVSAGLADRLGTFHSVMARLSRGARVQPRPARGASVSADARGYALSATGGTASIEVDREQGRAAGAAEAKARIAAILDHEAAGDRQTFARHLAFSTDMSAEVAIGALLAAPAERRQSSLATLMMSESDTHLGAAPFTGGPETPMDPYERGRQVALRAKGKL